MAALPKIVIPNLSFPLLFFLFLLSMYHQMYHIFYIFMLFIIHFHPLEYKFHEGQGFVCFYMLLDLVR